MAGDDLAEAIRVLEGQLAPCGAKFAEPMVQAMKASLAQRTRDEEDLKTWALLMLMELGDLPADLVRRACREWLLSEKWLPTLAELIGQMQPELTKRRVMLDALRTPLPDVPPPAPTPQRMRAADVDAILRKHGVGKSDPRPSDVAQASPGLSQAQIEAAKAENQAAYWLKLMGAG